MSMSIDQILDKAGKFAVDRIKQNLVSSGEQTTGKTADSLRYEVAGKEDSVTLTIYGRPFFKATETGTKPSEKAPSPEMVESLTEWAQKKGVEAKPYAIAKSILKKGSRLYRKGGRKDIYSNVKEQIADMVRVEVIKSFKLGNNSR